MSNHLDTGLASETSSGSSIHEVGQKHRFDQEPWLCDWCLKSGAGGRLRELTSVGLNAISSSQSELS